MRLVLVEYFVRDVLEQVRFSHILIFKRLVSALVVVFVQRRSINEFSNQRLSDNV